MSKLNELLFEAGKIDQQLKDSITNGDYDLMTAIERSKVELQKRIYFEQRNDYAEKLNDLRIEKQCAVELSGELADELKAAAADVMEAKSRLYDCESAYSAITAKQYYVQTQLETNRQEMNRVNGLLTNHIQSRLSGIHDEMEATTNETIFS